EGRNTGPAGAQALGQGTLRVELQLQFAGQILPLELLVLAHIGRNHLADLPGFQQLAEAETVDAGIVGRRGTTPAPAVTQRSDRGLGNAAQAEAADRKGLRVGPGGGQRLGSGGTQFAALAGRGREIAHRITPTVTKDARILTTFPYLPPWTFVQPADSQFRRGRLN